MLELLCLTLRLVRVFVVVGAFLSLVLASNSSIVDDQLLLSCNGHGRPHPFNHTHPCGCESPYVGSQCETCRDGYYGNPRNGSLCFLQCSDDVLLRNFSLSGIGVPPAGFATHSPNSLPSICVWIISPDSSTSSTYADLSKLTIFRNAYSSSPSSPLAGSIGHIDTFNLTVQFLPSSRPSASPRCHGETVLLYDGLPRFLNTLSGTFHEGSGVPSGTVEQEERSLPDIEKLLASYTGIRLRHASFNAVSSLLTVVYLHDGVGAEREGFDAMVRVQRLDEAEPEEEEEEEPDAATCSCLLEPCHYSTDICTSTLIPSLTSTLRSLTPPSNRTHLCSGRIFQSAVYDFFSESMLIFGGVDMSSNICHGDIVQVNLSRLETQSGSGRWSGSGGVALSGRVWSGSESGWRVKVVNGGWRNVPSGRYQHSAVLVPGSEVGVAASMLLVGGMTSRTVVSRELWQYNLSTEQWTPLADLPMPTAAHTSTYTAGGVVIVIGGVTDDLSTRANVMSYNVSHDSWEVWPLKTSHMPGVYGHSAVYDDESQCVWVFGGVAYTRPSSVLSASLHSLHVPSRTWTTIKLRDQVFPRLFQSMVLIGQKLFIYGGLVADASRRGLEGVCPSSDITLVILDSNSTRGKAALSIQGGLPVRWGHSAVVTTHQEVFFTGGTDGQPVDSIDFLHNANNLCSLAQNLYQCQSISDCLSCVNTTDGSLIGCHGEENFSREVCRYQGGELGQGSLVDSAIGCDSFPSCESCSATDISRSLGCVWCGCHGSSSCSTMSECSCRTVNATTPEACPSDICGYPSCGDCLADDGCSWLGTRIQNSTSVSSEFTEWGCYETNASKSASNESHFSASVSSCPEACKGSPSCERCVSASSPQGGAATCLWATYSKECMSEGNVPLLCANGKCGAIATVTSECLLMCSQRLSCEECQRQPQCGWKLSNGTSGTCVGIADLEEAQLGTPYECPNCTAICGKHGHCDPTGRCSCDLGYVGETCEVACECNALGNCMDETEEGRRICVQCQGNTQGPSCNECKPNFVRLADDGVQCYSCLDFCNGNSAVCLSLAEIQNTENTTANYSKVLEESELRESDGVCVGCSGGTQGSRCHQCLQGYYNTSQQDGGGSRLTCTKCDCNGRGDECNSSTGFCICKNNTVSTSNLHNQCNTCANGYFGTPMNNSQCYKQLEASSVAKYTLPPRHATFIAIKSDTRLSNVDIYISVVVVHGSLDMYVSPHSTAVRLVEGAHGTSRIFISNEYQLVDKTRSRRSETPAESGRLMPGGTMRAKREFYGGTLSSSQQGAVLKYRIDERFILIIPPSNDSDSITTAQQYFISLFAQKNSSFLFEYRQEAPVINFNIFFGLFFAQMTFTACFMVAICKSIHTAAEYRQTVRNRRLRRRRAYRPIASILLYLHNGKEVTSIPLLDESKLEVDSLENDDHLKLSMGSTAPTKQGKHKKVKDVSKQDTKTRKSVEVLDASDIAIWPVTMQTTADETSSVYSVIVQLPSRKSPRHMLCAGSSLVHHAGTSGVDPPSSGMVLRRLKNRKSAARNISPVPEDAAEATTQL